MNTPIELVNPSDVFLNWLIWGSFLLLFVDTCGFARPACGVLIGALSLETESSRHVLLGIMGYLIELFREISEGLWPSP